MASPVLHVKDAYYFDVPKILWPSSRTKAAEFPDWWVRLDDDFQLHQAEILVKDLEKVAGKYKFKMPAQDELIHNYEHWKHADHHHNGHSLVSYLEHQVERAQKDYEVWKKTQEDPAKATFGAFLAQKNPQESAHESPQEAWFVTAWENQDFQKDWNSMAEESSSHAVVEAYVSDDSTHWDKDKLAGYNRNLSGKVVIYQPFGELTNLYEGEGFLISKFMVVELVVALLLAGLFIWLAKAIQYGQVARGRFRNLLEVFLTFMRDQVAKPAIGHDADKYVPFLWTVFLFVLFLNLAGMVPWVGSPTASFAVTGSLAMGTFVCVTIAGMATFGPIGFFKNLVPSMGLPLALGIFLVPIIFVIELVSFLIKHMVLSVRLLANMVAGHLVLAGIMGVAFSYEAVLEHSELSWGIAAVIAVIGSVLFSCLELFVAFLQAYVFTFLSALFIGGVVHEH